MNKLESMCLFSTGEVRRL